MLSQVMAFDVSGPYQEILEEFWGYRCVGLDAIGNKRIRLLLDETLRCITRIPEDEREYRELYVHMGESIGLERLNRYHALKFAEHAFRLGLHYNRRSLDKQVDTNPVLAEHYMSHCLAAYQKLEREKGVQTLPDEHLKRIQVITRLWENLRPTDETYSPLAIKARRQLLKNRYRD
jgi:hypothetical protein